MRPELLAGGEVACERPYRVDRPASPPPTREVKCLLKLQFAHRSGLGA